ncbi:MAG: hypothetical protein R3279_02710 [Putridiphycobacter sp.]|nr:hypothetical protein [Putridiphycobacter sp.]
MKLKRSTLGLMILAGTIGTTVTSCKKGCTDAAASNYDADAKRDDESCVYATEAWYTTETIAGKEYRKIVGEITANQTITAADNWLLSGGVFVNDGVTLTIEAGATINTADDGTTPFLSIKQGGKIMAEGTAALPIVFTPIKDNPQTGEWGGIIINGKAPINAGATAVGEGGTGTYGGTNAADNSGVLKYVRVEYAGKILGTDNELNGFSFNGVGSGTTLEYLQAYRGSDDGFEFFGGTVSLKYAVSSGNQDDSFDWTHGWSGNGQFWVVEQSTDGGDRGIEGDNLGDNNTATPYSNPTIANVTLIGAEDGDASNQGLKLREGMKGNFYNFVVTGFPKRGCQVEHDVTISNMANQDLNFKNSIIDNVSPFKFTSSAGNDTTVANMFTMPSYNNQTATDGSLVGFLNGYVGTSSTGGFNTSSLGSWFTAVSYIGAVETSNDWTAGWTKAL